jgi:hypothetical protein
MNKKIVAKDTEEDRGSGPERLLAGGLGEETRQCPPRESLPTTEG